MRAFKFMAVLTVAALIVGCGPADDTGQNGSSGNGGDSASGNQSSNGSDTNGAKVSVAYATWEEIQQMIKDQVGKVVVVDLWATP